MLGGGGAPVPWGRRQWVGINFCHPEVVKMQQQCHMQNTIFDLPHTIGSIHFFWENCKEKWKWQSIEKVAYMFFNHYINLCFFLMALGHSGFRQGPGETGKTLQKGSFCVVVSQGNSGNIVGKW